MLSRTLHQDYAMSSSIFVVLGVYIFVRGFFFKKITFTFMCRWQLQSYSRKGYLFIYFTIIFEILFQLIQSSWIGWNGVKVFGSFKIARYLRFWFFK